MLNTSPIFKPDGFGMAQLSSRAGDRLDELNFAFKATDRRISYQLENERSRTAEGAKKGILKRRTCRIHAVLLKVRFPAFRKNRAKNPVPLRKPRRLTIGQIQWVLLGCFQFLPGSRPCFCFDRHACIGALRDFPEKKFC